jgi:hypothetical protein
MQVNIKSESRVYFLATFKPKKETFFNVKVILRNTPQRDNEAEAERGTEYITVYTNIHIYKHTSSPVGESGGTEFCSRPSGRSQW